MIQQLILDDDDFSKRRKLFIIESRDNNGPYWKIYEEVYDDTRRFLREYHDREELTNILNVLCPRYYANVTIFNDYFNDYREVRK
jgi:uncharacterized protein YozE (UPF0346 family)